VTYAVSTADIEQRWRPLSDAESEIAVTLIDDAIILVDINRSSLAAAVASGAVPERIVVMTVAEAVIRVLANPDLLAQQSITADGGVSLGWQFQQKTPRPRMTLSVLDFFNIDQAMAAAGYGTGTTGSLRTVNSTRWTRSGAYCSGIYDIDDSEASNLTPNASVTDSVVINHSS
jgi:hypothetical protein